VHLCYDIAEMGTWERHGGFADSVTVDASFAYPLPTGMPSDVAAVLMCAGISVYAPLTRYAGDGPRVAIYGLGGLGHLAIQFAHALGYEVTAFSSTTAKEQEALGFGADHFVVTGNRDRMRPLDFEFDLLLCTAHGDVDWQAMIDLLEKHGRLVLVGFPVVSMWARDLVAHEVSITGSFLGNHAAMREMLSFAQAHGIAPRIERRPMSDVNDAIRRLKEGNVRYRVVLNHASSAGRHSDPIGPGTQDLASPGA
jgi:D-arabinose 1-dehydrogenase-like Zn-dependent alcohol dehydrogenase